MSESEIARILQQIREEEEAARRGLSDYTIISRHAFITTRVENIDRCFFALAEITGSEQAAMELFDVHALLLWNHRSSALSAYVFLLHICLP